MNSLPNEIEEMIISYIDCCKNDDSNKYYLVNKKWSQKINSRKCYRIKVFGRNICGYHNEKIIQMIRNSFFYTY